MWPILTRLSEKFIARNRQRHIRSIPRHERPRLEELEERLVLDAYEFDGRGDGVSWNDKFNWLNTTNGNLLAVPGPGDSATILAGFSVALGGGGATVQTATLLGGSSLTVSSSLTANYLATTAGSTFTVAGGSQPAQVSIDDYGVFSGMVFDSGQIIANTSGINGTGVFFNGGGALIGPGDLNGNLVAGPNSSFTFEFSPNNTLAAPYVFVPGATLGPGAGLIVVAAP